MAEGLLPAVVPEYRDFTVAGLINGEGIQSSSHRQGLFSATKVAVELVLGNGSTVVASKDQHQDLFAVVGASMGSVGIVTAATIRLVEAKPFVRCRYTRFDSLDAYMEAFTAALMKPAFLEGIIFGPDCYVLITGDFVGEPGCLPVVRQLASGQPYWYQHVRAAAEGRGPAEDVLSTLDYVARAERGGWWMA